MKRLAFGSLALATMVGGAVALGAGSAAAQKTQFVNIGTAGIGGGYYPSGGYICNLVNKSRKKLGHKIRCTVESTAGSVGNLRSIAAKELEVAIVQSDWQFHAYKGTSVFKKIGAQPELRFVAGLHSDAFQIVSENCRGSDTYGT